MRFIGDIDAEWEKYLNLIDGTDESIQVGDMGVGLPHNDGITLPPQEIIGTNHKFIRGNHDCLNICKNHPNWISDGTYNLDSKMMFIGGAYSVDKCFRTIGIDWWDDEELSHYKLSCLIDQCIADKPKIMVSHTCPGLIMSALNLVRIKEASRTGEAFDVILHQTPPKLWVFGHFHQNIDKIVNGVRFVCVNMEDYKDIDLTEYS